MIPKPEPQEESKPQEETKKNYLAIASLILGTLSVAMAQFCHAPGTITFCGGLGPVLALAAFITGGLGLRDAKELDGQGHRLAVGGLVTGGLSLLIFVAVFIPILAAPGGLWAHLQATPTPPAASSVTMTPTLFVPPSPITRRFEKFSITFTTAWDYDESVNYQVCQGTDGCLYLEHTAGDDTQFLILNDTRNQPIDLDAEDEQIWANYGSASLISGPEKTTVDERPAIERGFVTPDREGGTVYIRLILIANGYDVYVIYVQAPAEETMAKHEAEIDAIVDSIEFNDIASEPTPTFTPTPPSSPLSEEPQTYETENFSLTYPGGWTQADISGYEPCQSPDTDCLLLLPPTDDGPEFFFKRQFHDEEPDLDALDQAMWNPYQEVAELLSKEPVQLGGQRAIKRVFTLTSPNGVIYSQQIVAVHGYDSYLVAADAPSADSMVRYQSVIQDFFDSIQFAATPTQTQTP